MIAQAWIIVFSLLAVSCSQARRGDIRRWAPIFGLISQPAWLFVTWSAQQYGMFAVSIIYTAIWARGFYNSWCWR